MEGFDAGPNSSSSIYQSKDVNGQSTNAKFYKDMARKTDWGMNWEIWVNMMICHFAIMIGLISLIGGTADDQNSYATPQQYDDPSNVAPRIKMPKIDTLEEHKEHEDDYQTNSY